jgi:hypothetical protein
MNLMALMAPRVHNHPFTVYKKPGPDVVYIHNVNASVCESHVLGYPFDCWCAPRLVRVSEKCTPEHVIFMVYHKDVDKNFIPMDLRN